MPITFLEKYLAPQQQSDPAPDPRHQIWQSLQEGQLLIDVYERPDALVVRAPVAGVRPEHIEISLHGDMLTIRGKRQEAEEIHRGRYFYQECYWGEFSRTIILPTHVQAERIKALLKNGVLQIILPKALLHDTIPLTTEEHFLT